MTSKIDESTETQEYTHDSDLREQALMNECTLLKKQCDELTMQKQAIETKSDMLLADSRRLIEEKDVRCELIENELKHLRETTTATSSNLPYNNQPDNNEYNNDQKILNELKDENAHLKDEVITLRKTVKELEDWNEDYRENNSPKTIDIPKFSSENEHSDLLISRNRQLENDLQRLQLQQRNNQLALERLDECEETICQLQEELDQLRSNKKKQSIGNDEDMTRLLTEEQKRYDALSNLLEDTRLQSEEKILQTENNLKEKFDQEKQILQEQLQHKEKQIEIERNEREDLQQQLNTLQKLNDNQMEEQENRLKETNLREMLERQLIEINEYMQSLENDKIELNNQLDELRQQLESRDRQIQTFQTSAVTPGSPPTITSSSHVRDLSPPSQKSQLEVQIFQNKQQFRQLNSIYDQFVALLPNEFSSSDNTHLSFVDQFVNLYEQFSTYMGTFSIIQEELDSLKQILIEKQDELEKLRSHLELTTDKLTQLQEEQLLSLNKDQSYESDEDELEEILGFHQRAPSRQSFLSITPGEKQQLIAQNELLSSLLNEKEQELIILQQAEKTREDLRKNLEILRGNLQQMEIEKEVKQVELNDIRNILDEKLRENSSLKKEKMYFIDKLAEFERERQEQQVTIQLPPKQSSQERETSPTLITANTSEKNIEQLITQEQYEKLRSDYDQLLELSKQQHDESLSYYNEYTNILTLYNDLNKESSQLQIDYESLQSLIQQKNEAYLQCQNELNTYQNLLYHQKKKSDDIDLLHSTLNQREIDLQQLINNEKQLLSKQSELELNIKLLEENNFKLKSNQPLFEHIEIDLKRCAHERDIAIVEKKQLENQMELNREKLLRLEEREQELINEVACLHQTEKLLRNQLEQLENSNRSQIELNINSELITELETLKDEYTKMKELNASLNNQLQDQIKYLQNSLEQCQQEREQYLNEHFSQYQDSLREQISITARLTNENNEIRQRLEEYNETLSSVNRLHDEIKTKDLLIQKLQTEIDCKTHQIVEYSEDLQTTDNTRVEKQLVKHIILSYFNTPIDKKQEVIPILGALLGFTQEEYQKAMNALSNNYNNSTGTNWLTGWLSAHPFSTQSDNPVYHPDKSFAELLIQYVDQQSPNTLQEPTPKLNTDECNSKNSALSTSDNQLLTVASMTSNVEQDTNILNQSSLPAASSIIIDDLLKI